MKETRKSERCASGDECPAVREIGRPEKLGRHNKDHYCYRCRTRRADERRRAAGNDGSRAGYRA